MNVSFSVRFQKTVTLIMTVAIISLLIFYGYLPKSAQLEQSSRYLGLDFSKQPENNFLVELLEKHVAWQRLLRL